MGTSFQVFPSFLYISIDFWRKSRIPLTASSGLNILIECPKVAMAEIGAQHPEQIKNFDRGYRFDEKRSTDTEYVFIRNTDKSHTEERT